MLLFFIYVVYSRCYAVSYVNSDTHQLNTLIISLISQKVNTIL